RASSRSRHSRSPSPRRRTPSRSRSRTPEHLYSILVTNLTRNVKEEHVKEIFSQYGTISRIEFPMNKRLNTNCGKAYIDYGTQEDADKALSYMDDAQLDGKRIVCTVAPSRRSRSPSPKPRSRSPIRRGGGNDIYIFCIIVIFIPFVFRSFW
ncbi:RNA-binding domain-containing protein, partial [Backusella circina FSU 941]